VSPTRYTPPPPGVGNYIGRAGLLVEVAPNNYVEIILEIRHGDPDSGCDVEITNRSDDPVFVADLLEPIRMTTAYADIHLRGRVISREEAERPSWAGPPQGEIEARRELEA
jgi:hypothetical protein